MCGSSYVVKSEAEFAHLVKTRPHATTLYYYTLVPLVAGAPHIPLCAWCHDGSSESFTSELVIECWRFLWQVGAGVSPSCCDLTDQMRLMQRCGGLGGCAHVVQARTCLLCMHRAVCAGFREARPQGDRPWARRRLQAAQGHVPHVPQAPHAAPGSGPTGRIHHSRPPVGPAVPPSGAQLYMCWMV